MRTNNICLYTTYENKTGIGKTTGFVDELSIMLFKAIM